MSTVNLQDRVAREQVQDDNTAPFSLHGRSDAVHTFGLWALTPTGDFAMQAKAEIA
jgi:hypothetical protein